ncbi:MAG: T9SS type A sorting domain-containing protein, partial [Flavobacteriales bacterium]|nr:T9SS type A sorting domain-containing protein [Flavobacteriales bacterium]
AVGIEEEAALVQVQLVPNPVQDLLTVTSGNSTIQSVQVVDMAGRVALNVAGNTQMAIDVAVLPAGIYVVQVFTNNGIAVRRVVKG